MGTLDPHTVVVTVLLISLLGIWIFLSSSERAIRTAVSLAVFLGVAAGASGVALAAGLA